jgi:hypothetical protein
LKSKGIGAAVVIHSPRRSDILSLPGDEECERLINADEEVNGDSRDLFAVLSLNESLIETLNKLEKQSADSLEPGGAFRVLRVFFF